MTGKPIWLLDIDGVLNALAYYDKDYVWGTMDDYQIERCNGYTLQVAKAVVVFVNTINCLGNAEVRWLTTWEQDAVDVMAPQFGFDKFPVQTEVMLSAKRSWWWKQDRADAAIAEGRPVIWTDDDHMWLESSDYSLEGDILKIRPDTRIGLTPDHVKRISEFVYDHRAPEATESFTD